MCESVLASVSDPLSGSMNTDSILSGIDAAFGPPSPESLFAPPSALWSLLTTGVKSTALTEATNVSARLQPAPANSNHCCERPCRHGVVQRRGSEESDPSRRVGELCARWFHRAAVEGAPSTLPASEILFRMRRCGATSYELLFDVSNIYVDSNRQMAGGFRATRHA